MSTENEFPRPCKNCGNQVEMYKGKLVHSYRKRERCRIFRAWDFERDEEGQVKAMHHAGDYPIPDPPRETDKAAANLARLEEWNRIYGVSDPQQKP